MFYKLAEITAKNGVSFPILNDLSAFKVHPDYLYFIEEYFSPPLKDFEDLVFYGSFTYESFQTQASNYQMDFRITLLLFADLLWQDFNSQP